MADDAAAWRGRIIDGRYEVDDVLGRGGMGVVLRARHKITGGAVAIKMLRPELARDPELQRRFHGEARASNAIGHPGIIQVFDAGRDAAGELYFAMELLEGESLRAPIARGAMPAREVKRIGLELLAALGAAHARGFIHRDLKPENVFLVAPNATVKLLDFGLAKVIAAKPSTIGATAAGALLGTVAYMAPEQLEDARAVDPRADLWAVGVILFEMLAGRLPFDAYTPQALFVAVATATPISIRVPMPSSSQALVELFARALARKPQERFGSTSELAAALVAAFDGPAPAAKVPVVAAAAAPAPAPAPVAPAPVAPAPVAPVAPRARGPMLIAGAAILAVVGVVVAYLATRQAPARTPPPQQPPVVAIDAAAPVVAIDAAPPVVVAIDAAAPVVAIDAAAPIAIDAAPPPIDAARIDARPPIDAAPPSASNKDPGTGPLDPGTRCATGCEQLALCDLADPTCAADCAQHTDVAKCLSDSIGSCERSAACVFLIRAIKRPAAPTAR